jgi:hypothetical protein
MFLLLLLLLTLLLLATEGKTEPNIAYTYRVSHKKRPTLVSQFISPSWQVSSKVSTVWPCSVHAVGENDPIFYSKVKYK